VKREETLTEEPILLVDDAADDPASDAGVKAALDVRDSAFGDYRTKEN
jgi:hypothetical protein